MARVLVVDDDVDCVRSLTRLLREQGHRPIRVARLAATALQDAVAFVPSIVFIDIELPDMSGHDLARLLHQHPQLQGTRLIALTDSAEHPDREHARVSGFERFLVKPITAATLQEVLRPSRRPVP